MNTELNLPFLWWYCESTILTSSIQWVSLFQCSMVISNLWTVSYLMPPFLWWYYESNNSQIINTGGKLSSVFNGYQYVLNCFISHVSFPLILWIHNSHIIDTGGKFISVFNCNQQLVKPIHFSCLLFFDDIMNPQFSHHQYSV